MADLNLYQSLVASAEGGGHHGPNFLGLMVYILLVVGVMFGLMASAKKGLNSRFFTRPITQKFEQLYLFIENLCIGIIGSHGARYIPMIMTFWLVIFISNLVALFFPTSPTADLSFNLGLALISIAYVQYEGMRANGFVGHWRHFAGPKLGPALIIINIMLFGIELVSEMMKNLSLSLRLYGNIDGGHRAADAMTQLSSDYYIPLGAFLLPIKLLTCVVQALIFSLLTCVYISLVTHHDEGHADDQHGSDELAAAH
ncbi:MAG: F0F1 ATP synthase subunit A [Chthonomonas sp.]|nr:F0F1 ATP synthase subunit A [Chthonomonas sp.]